MDFCVNSSQLAADYFLSSIHFTSKLDLAILLFLEKILNNNKKAKMNIKLIQIHLVFAYFQILKCFNILQEIRSMVVVQTYC